MPSRPRWIPLLTPLLRAPIRRPWVTLALTAVVAVLSAFSASRITPTPSLKPMFSTADPAAQAMMSVLDDFRAADNLLLLVSVPPPEAGAPRLSPAEVTQRLTTYADRLEQAIHADDVANSQVVSFVYRPAASARAYMENQVLPAGLFYLSDADFARFKQRITPEHIRAQIQRNTEMISTASPTADAMSGRILQDPLRLSELMVSTFGGPSGGTSGGGGLNPTGEGQGPLIGADGRTLLIRVGADQPAGNIDFTNAFMDTMRRVVKRADPGGLDVAYTGAYAIAEHTAGTIRRDMERSVGGSLVLLLVLFVGAYRRWWSFPLTFVPVAVGILAGFGVYGLFDSRLTPVTAASGAILAGLGVDYCVHYLSHYHVRRARGMNPAHAAGSTLALAPAMSAACVTSLIGFLAIAFSTVPALRDFAWIGALGLGGAFLGSLLVLPAMIVLVDRKPGRPARSPLRVGLGPLMHGIDRRRKTCLITTGVLAAAAAIVLIVLGPVGFSPDLSELNPQPSAPLQAQDRLNELFPGAMESAQVYLEADTPDQLVAEAHDADAALDQTELIKSGGARVFSIATLVPDPRIIDRRRGEIQQIDAGRVIVDFRAAIDDSPFSMQAYEPYVAFLGKLLSASNPPTLQTLAEYPELAGTLLPRSAFAEDPPPTTRALSIVDFTKSIDDVARRRAAHSRVRAAVASVDGATATGMDLIAMDMEQTVRGELGLLLTMAGLAVAVWLGVMFRSPVRVALTLIPPVFAGLVLLAVMRVLGYRLNIVNLIALPLLAGIGVDDGIFLVSIAARHAPGSPSPAALRRPGGTVSRMIQEMAASTHAITVTSLTTALAFGSLLLTSTPAIRSLGLVLSVGILASWAGSVFALAPILIARARRRAEKING